MTASSTKDQQLRFDPMLVGGDMFVLLSVQMASVLSPGPVWTTDRLLTRLKDLHRASGYLMAGLLVTVTVTDCPERCV